RYACCASCGRPGARSSTRGSKERASSICCSGFSSPSPCSGPPASLRTEGPPHHSPPACDAGGCGRNVALTLQGMPAWLGRRAETVPNRPALITGDGTLTFAQLHQRVNERARWLLGLRVEPGAR